MVRIEWVWISLSKIGDIAAIVARVDEDYGCFWLGLVSGALPRISSVNRGGIDWWSSSSWGGWVKLYYTPSPDGVEYELDPDGGVQIRSRWWSTN